jgi:uncharacterized membrane protein YeaQ/YmgE (transglycosylase-associated protein family)
VNVKDEPTRRRRQQLQFPYPAVRRRPQREVLNAEEKKMELASWILVGAVAGLLARWILPRSTSDGIVVTVLLGMAGASVGGFVVGVPGGSGTTGIDFWSFLIATLGAIVLLFVYGLIARRAA